MKIIIVMVTLILGGAVGLQYGLAYADKATLASAVDSLSKNSGVASMSEDNLRNKILSEAERNNIRFLEPENIILETGDADGEWYVTFDYVTEIDFFGLHKEEFAVYETVYLDPRSD